MKLKNSAYKSCEKTLQLNFLLYLFLIPLVCFSQVVNGSFETDGNPSLENWIILCNDGESFEDAPSGGGSWCLRLLPGNFQGCYPRIAEQILTDLSNGDILETSVWVRQDEQKSSSTRVYLKVFDSEKTTFLSIDSTTSKEWTKLMVVDTLSIDEGDSASIILDSGITSGPDILGRYSYFDLVEIKKKGQIHAFIDNAKNLSVKEFKLDQNYPNPFNPSTTIKYALPRSEHVTITLYNTLGQKIETLVNTPMPIGQYQVEFNGQNLPSGIYFYRLEAGEYVQTRKMLLVR
jgi:hypothetical protein